MRQLSIAHYLIKFYIFSFLGWVWETIYCSLKARHFQNRGFLFGPLCPIYGCCLMILQFMYDFVPAIGNGQLPVWQLFLICAAGSALAEYSTSWYLEKRFCARWWDYSRVPLNLQGRICLPITTCFGVAGIVFVKYLMPLFQRISDPAPLLLEFIVLVMTGLFGADFALTETSLHDLVTKIETMQEKYIDCMENAFQAVITMEHDTSKKTDELKMEAKKHLKDTSDGMAEHLRDAHSRFRSMADSLSRRQRYILGNIEKYHPTIRKPNGINFGEELRRFCKETTKHTHRQNREVIPPKV